VTVTTPIRLVLDIDVSLVPSSSVNVWLTGLHAPVPSSSRHRQARPSRHRTDRRSLPPASRCGHGRSASLSVSAGLGCLHPLPDLDRKPSGTQSPHAQSLLNWTTVPDTANQRGVLGRAKQPRASRALFCFRRAFGNSPELWVHAVHSRLSNAFVGSRVSGTARWGK
jgi:hypothetical protein